MPFARVQCQELELAMNCRGNGSLTLEKRPAQVFYPGMSTVEIARESALVNDLQRIGINLQPSD
jgi:hypothetical protein